VSGVELTGNNQTIDLKITGTSTTTAANVSVGLDDIKSRLTPNHEYAADSPAFSISLQTSAAPKPIPTEQKLSFTGELKGTAPTKTNKQPSGGAKNTKQPAKRTPEGPINNR
jgi:type 1 fimbria pilin